MNRKTSQKSAYIQINDNNNNNDMVDKEYQKTEVMWIKRMIRKYTAYYFGPSRKKMRTNKKNSFPLHTKVFFIVFSVLTFFFALQYICNSFLLFFINYLFNFMFLLMLK